MDEAKVVHPGLGVEDTGARREHPDIGKVEGMGAAGVIENREVSMANSVGGGGAVGSIDNWCGMVWIEVRKMSHIRDDKISCLGVNKGNSIKCESSGIGKSNGGWRDEGWG